MGMVAECQKRCDISIGDEPDVAATTAIAAIGAALGDMGLATERDAACTAVTTTHIDLTLVYKP
jgi:hypothetical protein